MCEHNLNHCPERRPAPTSAIDAIKSELAELIARLLEDRELTVRSAGAATATSAADISRIRQRKLERFSVDRLLAIVTRLDTSLEVSLLVRNCGDRLDVPSEAKT